MHFCCAGVPSPTVDRGAGAIGDWVGRLRLKGGGTDRVPVHRGPDLAGCARGSQTRRNDVYDRSRAGTAYPPVGAAGGGATWRGFRLTIGT